MVSVSVRMMMMMMMMMMVMMLKSLSRLTILQDGVGERDFDDKLPQSYLQWPSIIANDRRDMMMMMRRRMMIMAIMKSIGQVHARTLVSTAQQMPAASTMSMCQSR